MCKVLVVLAMCLLGVVAHAEEVEQDPATLKPFVIHMDRHSCAHVYTYASRMAPRMLANPDMNMNKFAEDMVRVHVAANGIAPRVPATNTVLMEQVALLFIKQNVHVFDTDLKRFEQLYTGRKETQVIPKAIENLMETCNETDGMEVTPFVTEPSTSTQ